MKERFSIFKEKSFELVQKLTKIQKVSLLVLSIVFTATVGTLVYASGTHDDAVPVTAKQGEQVSVRKVGDVDADAISQEGLASFYGEITSKDVASVHTSREGVISSWNVSVGDYVSTGNVLGYVTITGVSAEQQQQLAQQQANALKAQLDLETAQKVAEQTESVFGKISASLQSVANKQRALYDGTNGVATTTYQTELQAITTKQTLLTNKIQDFGKTALLEMFPVIINTGSVPSTQTQIQALNTSQLRNGVGTRDSSAQYSYVAYLASYISLVNNRTLTENDIRLFLDKTNTILSQSSPSDTLTSADLADATIKIKDLQTDFRDLSDKYTQATIDKASKERERSQIDIELAKSLAGFDNELNLKKLEQTTANERAKNEAKGAELLAQKLAISSGGIIPILASRNGIVATVSKNVGDYVTISDRIGLISTQNPTKIVRFTIPPSWRDIKKGDSLSILWRPEFAGGSAVITGISPIIDEKGGHQAEAMISKDTVFPVGSSVRIIPESSKKGVFVNRKAIVFDGVTPYVWIVMENDTIRKEEVKPGRQLGEYVEILSGLERGFSYLVILDPTVSLQKGESVSSLTSTKVDPTAKKEIQNESVPHSHDE